VEPSDTQSLHRLNDDKTGRLIAMALEEFGAGLTCIQFNDVMLALFKHIAVLRHYPRNAVSGT